MAPEFKAPDGSGWYDIKGIIWSVNPLGDAIGNFIYALVDVGMLEQRNESDIQFRWNKEYKI